MGLSQTVTFSTDPPAWPAVRDWLTGHGFPVQTRMIDGELAFPDEEPPPAWRELRLATPQGMVTVRRGPNAVEVVTWGNADEPMRQAWNAVALAFAAAGGVLVAAPEATAAWPELPEPIRRALERT